MPRNAHVFVLAAVLLAIGTGIFIYKITALGFPLTAEQKADAWNIELKLTFDDEPGPFKATLALPNETGGFLVSRQAYVSSDYGITHDGDAYGNRLVIFTKREGSGDETIYYRAYVASYPKLDQKIPAPAPRVTPPAWSDSRRAAANDLLERLQPTTADAETLALNLVDELTSLTPNDTVRALLPTEATQREIAHTAVKVLRTTEIPARAVHGLDLGRAGSGQPHFVHWIEIHADGFWRPIGLGRETRTVPPDYMAWWRGDRDLTVFEGASEVETGLSVAHRSENAVETAVQQGLAVDEPMLRFSLFNVPLEEQLVYRVLLLIPVGAAVMVIARQLIGIETFGTFMPVLIALAFRQTHLLNGIFLFGMIVSLGLAVRFYLERLKLLLVPRLASMLIVVVLMMAAISVFTQQLGTTAGLSLALFPMVILTMTIERMSMVWDEDGAKEAIKQGLGSLALATVAYLTMFNEPVQYLTFTFPELLLVLLAITLLMGRYTGYRLMELWRFRDLAQKESK